MGIGMRTFTRSTFSCLVSRTNTRNHTKRTRRAKRVGEAGARVRTASTAWDSSVTDRAGRTTSTTRVATGAGRRSLLTRAAYGSGKASQDTFATPPVPRALREVRQEHGPE